MLVRPSLALALILLLALAVPAGAEPAETSSALQMMDVVSTLQRVLDEHPSPPDAAFLMRAGMRGMASRLQAMGLDGGSLFTVDLTGSLVSDAAAVDQALGRIMAGRPEEDRGKVLWAGLAAALDSLDDPGTRLYEPGAYRASLEELGYALGGVGFFVDEEKDEKGRLVIVEMFEGFPAERLGIRRGDRLVAADGHPTKDLTFEEMARIVRGPVGTRITITVQRGDGPPKDYTITREWLNPNPKGSEARLVGASTGYLKVKYLGHRVHHDLRREIETLVEQGARRLVLDLRNCPGTPAGAVGVADLFLPPGKTVMTEVYRSATEDRQTGGPEQFDLPLVVLINRYSSSAATILAGALRDHGRAVLVGEQTDPDEAQSYEKVAVELRDGSTAAVTIAYYKLPRGKSLWKESIHPDVEIPLDDPTVNATGQPGDPQFDRAVDMVGSRS